MLLSKTLQSSTLKLAFIYVAVFCLAIFALLGYVYWTTATYLYEKSDAAVTAERALLIKAYDSAGRDGLIGLIDRRTSDRHFDDWAYLLADDGLAYVAGNLASWPAALHGEQGWGEFAPPDWRPRASGRVLLRATYQVLPDGRHLLVARDVEDLARLGDKITTGLATAAALFFALAVAAGISTARRSVARIEAINATSRKIMRAGLGERIPLRGTRDEWDGLAENLNSMLDRIQELAESNRQVSDNVAHDLRTPLTRLRGRLERASTAPPDRDHYRALVDGTIAELDEILKTFSSLLRISQIEMRERMAAFHQLDLSELAREVIDLFEPAAEEEGTRLRVSASERVCIVGDRDLLFDAISNLVDNAIKHGGRRGEIGVGVASDAGGPVLSVADRGPGISPEDRKHVLKRFYRLERSRNSPGNGLGLSLVAAVAGLHGARIEMADNAPGLRIELRFPVPHSAASRMSDQPYPARAR